MGMPVLDVTRFKHKPPERRSAPNILNSAQMREYENELRLLKGTVGTGFTRDRENPGVLNPNMYNSDKARKRIAEIERILERNSPPSVNSQDKTLLSRRMKELEVKIREHRPLTKNQLHNPNDIESTREYGQKLFDKMQITQPLEQELKNIRKILFPDDPRAGDLSYLNRIR